MIARLLMVLVGFIVAMLGVIYAMHTDDVYLGMLIATGGVAAMMEGYHMSYYWCHGPIAILMQRKIGCEGLRVLKF